MKILFRPLQLSVLVLPLVLSLSACAANLDAALPTTIPTEQLPTIIALTVQASKLLTPAAPPIDTPMPGSVGQDETSTSNQTPLRPAATLAPTDTATPSNTPTPTESPQPTIAPTASNTPRPEIPPGAIRISRPAPLSRLVSPIQVRANLVPGAGGVFRLELLGEDGRLLASKTLTYLGERVNLSTELEFEITATAEAGRLQISTLDEYGRTLALSSSSVILLSIGEPEINTASDLRERIYIIEPSETTLVIGGSLSISGKARPNPQGTLLVELISTEGKVVGQRLAGVTLEEGEDYGTFSGEIPYTISEPTHVRVTVYERGDRIPGDTHISSMEILINP